MKTRRTQRVREYSSSALKLNRLPLAKEKLNRMRENGKTLNFNSLENKAQSTNIATISCEELFI